MEYQIIYKKVEKFVTDLFKNHSSEIYAFHNLEHTLKVVKRTNEIAGHYNVSERDSLTLYVAAWFHDTGHLFTEPKLHEAKSVEIMKDFMLQYTTDQSLIDEIARNIMATRRIIEPVGLLQQIICDADTYHLGTKEFKETNKNVKKEEKARLGGLPADWDHKVIAFLESQQFYTSYAKKLLEETKNKNMAKFKNKHGGDKEKAKDPETEVDPNQNELDEVGPEITEKSGLMTKGIQTMLRLTSDNHIQLSGMADGKANILISVNAIIISVILSVLLRRLETDTHLTIPTCIFLLFSLTTIVISILATRPKLTDGNFNEEDVKAKKTNLLFFGNFHKATLEHYENAMRHMMRDPDYLYGSLIKDIYYLGVVLGRKYKMIRMAYNIFMVGIIVSVLAFTLAVMINQRTSITEGNPAVSPF
jgi:HD superfamily phosphodiesterase